MKDKWPHLTIVLNGRQVTIVGSGLTISTDNYRVIDNRGNTLRPRGKQTIANKKIVRDFMRDYVGEEHGILVRKIAQELPDIPTKQLRNALQLLKRDGILSSTPADGSEPAEGVSNGPRAAHIWFTVPGREK